MKKLLLVLLTTLPLQVFALTNHGFEFETLESNILLIQGGCDNEEQPVEFYIASGEKCQNGIDLVASSSCQRVATELKEKRYVIGIFNGPDLIGAPSCHFIKQGENISIIANTIDAKLDNSNVLNYFEYHKK